MNISSKVGRSQERHAGKAPVRAAGFQREGVVSGSLGRCLRDILVLRTIS